MDVWGMPGSECWVLSLGNISSDNQEVIPLPSIPFPPTNASQKPGARSVGEKEQETLTCTRFYC